MKNDKKDRVFPQRETSVIVDNAVEQPEMKAAQTGFAAIEAAEAKQATKTIWPWLVIVLVALICFGGIFALGGCENSDNQSKEVVDNEKIVADDLGKDANGNWELGEDFTFEAGSKNPATAGNASFNKGGVSTPSEMTSWLSDKSASAKALIEFIQERTGASESAILDSKNWIAVKAEKDFVYPGNTSFQGGKVVDSGDRAGVAGEIFLVFINPENSKLVYVRSACANPQGFTPYLQPKSSDPADYKQPGDGDERDSGEGTKPPATVTTPAETTPPTVVTDNDKPGDEPEDVVAPGADPPATDPTPTPDPEPGTEPSDGDPNEGDPGLPPGF